MNRSIGNKDNLDEQASLPGMDCVNVMIRFGKQNNLAMIFSGKSDLIKW